MSNAVRGEFCEILLESHMHSFWWWREWVGGKKGLHKGRKKKHTVQLDKLPAQKGTHMLSGSCTLAWASSSEVRDATLGGRGTPAEEGDGPGGDAS